VWHISLSVGILFARIGIGSVFLLRSVRALIFVGASQAGLAGRRVARGLSWLSIRWFILIILRGPLAKLVKAKTGRTVIGNGLVVALIKWLVRGAGTMDSRNRLFSALAAGYAAAEDCLLSDSGKVCDGIHSDMKLVGYIKLKQSMIKRFLQV
jgi:hypothetical protein